ncbi:MAG TPA: metalloregulator ArsR/SmtB family transcription factor [Holophaga sp.]|nr:metalloregulator ArsR/SmtB family transcription factor [Holophaga sp.]
MCDVPLSNPMIDEAGKLFQAMGDPSRLKLLRALMTSPGPLAQHALAQAAGLSQANVSKHLACLAQSGLVDRERRGQQVLFRLSGSLVRELCGLVKNHVLTRSRSVYASLQ